MHVNVKIVNMCYAFSSTSSQAVLHFDDVLGGSAMKCNIYELYFAKMAARYKKILNTKYTKKDKLYTDNKNPMLVIGVNKRNKQWRIGVVEIMIVINNCILICTDLQTDIHIV